MKGVISESRMVPKSQNKTPVKLQIPVGQWNGNGPYTYTVNVTNVTANTDIDYTIDESQDYLTSEIVVATGAGTVTLTTASLPTGTVNVTVYFRGVTGEINVQVLADVYSKSQVDTLLGAKVNTLDVVDNLTSTATNAPLSANMGKTLEEHIQQSTANLQYGRMSNNSEIAANTMTEFTVTYPTAYSSVSYPIVSLQCWTDPDTISYIIKTYSRSGFTIRVKSTNKINAGDITITWLAHGN